MDRTHERGRVNIIETHGPLLRNTLGVRPVTAERLNSGRNSNTYRLELEDGRHVAVKCYPVTPGDDRNRQETEFSAIRFLAENGITCIPKPLLSLPEAGLAVYEFIQGGAVTDPGEADIDALTDFLLAVDDLRGHPQASGMAPASEACFSMAELRDNILGRLKRLDASPHDDIDRKMLAFLADELTPFFQMKFDAAQTMLTTNNSPYLAGLPPEFRTLSPSDFGFHNALRRPDATLVFFDLEYFGTDDPAKLVNDFALHPAMDLAPGLHARFRNAMFKRFDRDPDFADRQSLLYPLYGIKWCCILLNEFLSGDFERRTFAGCDDDWAASRSRQLTKARNKLKEIQSHAD